MTNVPPAFRATGPALLSLDQADWSYLADRKLPVEEASLRALGARQEVIVFVSFEHLLETSGLKRGYGHRMQFVREFPVTGSRW